MKEIVFISRSAAAQDEFSRQVRVVQPEQPVRVCVELPAGNGTPAELAAVILDCRDDHGFGDQILAQIRSRQEANPGAAKPYIIGIIQNSEAFKAWAVTSGLDDVIISPFTLLDLQLRIAGMRNALGQREEIARLQQTTQAVESEASRFRALAYTDHLTGLPNRLAMERWARETIAQADGDTSFAFQMLDLNGFKLVNDTYGHHIGDLLLKQVSERVAAISRRLDLVVRLGGDEIAIMQVGAISRGDCLALAGRLLEALRQPFLVDGHSITITASIGSALYPQDASDLPDLMRHADKAMYTAKTLGPGGFASFHADDEAAACE